MEQQQQVKRGRGRPPKPDSEAKRSAFQTRIRETLRERLAAAAAANGRSLSEEIEQRLEDSFGRIDRLFGGPAGLHVSHMLTASFHATGSRLATAKGHPEWSVAEWLADREIFEEALAALVPSVWSHHPQPVTHEDYRRWIERLYMRQIGRDLTEKMRKRERDSQAEAPAQADAA